MNELTIGFGDEASLSMGDMEGSHLLGALRERCRRKFWRWAPLTSGAHQGMDITPWGSINQEL